MTLEEWLLLSQDDKAKKLGNLLEDLYAIESKVHQLHGTRRQGKLSQYKTILEREISDIIEWENSEDSFS